jgi:hypothetical protein
MLKCQNTNIKIYETLMICLSPSDAEGMTVADISLRYVHWCYMVGELQLFRGIPWAFGEIFLSCLNFKPLWFGPCHSARQFLRFRRGNELPMYRVTANRLYSKNSSVQLTRGGPPVCILKKLLIICHSQNAMVRNISQGLEWGGGLMWVLEQTFSSHNMRKIWWLAEGLLDYQERLCSMDLV